MKLYNLFVVPILLALLSLPMPGGAQSMTPSPIPTPAPTAEPVAAETTAEGPRTLQKGMTGPDVLHFKLRLRELGYFSQAAEITDRYNVTMVHKVMLYQQDLGLKATGIATPELQAIADTPFGGIPTPEPVPTPSLPTLTEDGFLAANQQEYIYDAQDGNQWIYISEDLHIVIDRYTQAGKYPFIWYETDIRFKGDEALKRYEVTPKYKGKFTTKHPFVIAQENNLVLAFSDDFYGFRIYQKRKEGIIIKNGTVIADDSYPSLNVYLPPLDIMAFFADGSAKTFYCGEHTAEELVEMGAVDTLCFGPILLRNGELGEQVSRGKYNSREPRCALGIYEPNHYLLITVEGRHSKSAGVGLPWIAERMKLLGVQDALNLDGGNTAALVFRGVLLNKMGNFTSSNYNIKGVRSVSSLFGIGHSLTPLATTTPE